MTRVTSIVEPESAFGRLDEQVLACVRGSWRSLVVVSTEPGSSALVLAEAVVARCNLTGTQNSAQLFSAERLSRAAITNLVADLTTVVERGGRAVAVVDPPSHRRSGIPVVMVVDAALLCVHLGVSTMRNARKTVELVGPERFIGAVTFEPMFRASP